mmetsp:Transcript_47949/g.71414  ORF Transcript_47949/g.71414 Transcript_47949/m.71414 type:complete len:235 (+) Transcript_47949:928-1632(+)
MTTSCPWTKTVGLWAVATKPLTTQERCPISTLHIQKLFESGTWIQTLVVLPLRRCTLPWKACSFHPLEFTRSISKLAEVTILGTTAMAERSLPVMLRWLSQLWTLTEMTTPTRHTRRSWATCLMLWTLSVEDPVWTTTTRTLTCPCHVVSSSGPIVTHRSMRTMPTWRLLFGKPCIPTESPLVRTDTLPFRQVAAGKSNTLATETCISSLTVQILRVSLQRSVLCLIKRLTIRR